MLTSPYARPLPPPEKEEMKGSISENKSNTVKPIGTYNCHPSAGLSYSRSRDLRLHNLGQTLPFSMGFGTVVAWGREAAATVTVQRAGLGPELHRKELLEPM